MIERIAIRNVASYADDVDQVIVPKQVNFLFGLNGSGKTTISRYLASPNDDKYSKCQIEDNDSNVKYFVYNQDFVNDNFSEEIPGVFVLGKDSKDAQDKIKQLNSEIKDLEKTIQQKSIEIDGTDDSPGYQKKLARIEEEYTNAFWEIKQSLDHEESPMRKALTGVLASKKAFKDKVISEYKYNQSKLLDKKQIEEHCKDIFDTSAEKATLIPIPSHFKNLQSLEQDEILRTAIVGKENVVIAEMIKRLNNSDWINSGRQYLPLSNGKCPFCQQALPNDFRHQIEDYFDESYKVNLGKVSALKNNYSFVANELEIQIQTLIDSHNDFLNISAMNEKFIVLKEVLNSNIEIIKNKQLIPSSIVELESIHELSTDIITLIQEANEAINEHNARIDNIKEEKTNLKSAVWKYILTRLSSKINDYNRKLKENQQALENSKAEKQKAESERRIKETELREVEKELTSIKPIADDINSILKNYGFNNFILRVNKDQRTYQFVRANNEPAFDSLSEGERNFVTFLYFIHTLKGNTGESGHSNKVLVIDDPVSSLDSDVLFLVSSLIRDFFNGVFNNNSKEGIKQIFVLSHNLYFFKEVSYPYGKDRRDKNKNKDNTGYWIVSKINDFSRIIQHDENPVHSTYEMLWEEVIHADNNPTNINTVTLGNTMRRILEYYFKFLGGISLNRIHVDFPDGERQICKSLISWANADSHSFIDDLSFTPAQYDAQKMQKVFKHLFEITGHLSHYEMMMRIENTPNNTEEPAHG